MYSISYNVHKSINTAKTKNMFLNLDNKIKNEIFIYLFLHNILMFNSYTIKYNFY